MLFHYCQSYEIKPPIDQVDKKISLCLILPCIDYSDL